MPTIPSLDDQQASFEIQKVMDEVALKGNTKSRIASILNYLNTRTGVAWSLKGNNILSSAYLGSINEADLTLIRNAQVYISLLSGGITNITGKVGINTPSPKAALEINSTSDGFLIPRLFQAQIDLIVNPVESLMLFNKDTKKYQFYNNGKWVNFISEEDIANIYDEVVSGIKGVATQTNAPTVYDPVLHPNGLTEIYRVFDPLTSPNSWGNIAVTQAELNANDIYFVVTNGAVTKKPSAKVQGRSVTSIAKTATVGEVDTYTITYSDATTTTFNVTNGSTAKLPLYSAIKSSNITADTQFIDDENGNIQYRVKTGQTLLTTEVPANVVGVKVERIGSDKTVESFNKTSQISTVFEVGGILKNDNTIGSDPNNKVMIDVPTAGAEWIDLNLKRTYTTAGNVPLYATLIGKKADNSLTVLVPVTSTAGYPVENFRVNISEYVTISLGWNSSQGYTPSFKFISYAKSDVAKTYIDAKTNLFEGTTKLTGDNLILDLNTSKNYYFKANSATVNIDFVNVKINDFASIYVDVATVPTLSFNGIVTWQNGIAPSMVSGMGYYIILNTYNGGYTWIASVVGEWVSVARNLIALDRFERPNGVWTTDEMANIFTISTGDVLSVIDKKLSVSTKTNAYPWMYIDAIGNYYAEITLSPEDIYTVKLAFGFKTSDTEYYTFGFTNLNLLQVHAMVGGNYVVLGNAVGYTPVENTNVKLGVKKTGLKTEYYVNGRKISETVFEVTNKVGVLFRKAGGSITGNLDLRVKEFKVLSL